MGDVKKGLRTVRNVVHNYNDAQVKVREATSNDPWGPAASLMSEVSDMTFNHIAFSDIMQMLWKRMNDNGKDWRHVYKALVVLDYILKTGSDKVAQHCKENLYFIQTLQNFQYVEELKDHGMNVREKAKQVVALLTDEERLKNERVKAQKTRERFQYTGGGVSGGLHRGDDYSDRGLPGGSGSFVDTPHLPTEIENVRPHTANEEEIQLQIALAMSKEEAAEEERRRQRDDVRLQMAISESQNDYHKSKPKPISNADELFDVFQPTATTHHNASSEPWDSPAWSSSIANNTDNTTSPPDPWGADTLASTPFMVVKPSITGVPLDPWSTMTPMSTNSAAGKAHISPSITGESGKSRNIDDFLGGNASLVNLDSLITLPPRPAHPTTSLLSNPFGVPTTVSPNNPFHQIAVPAPTINQLRGPPLGAAPVSSNTNPHSQPSLYPQIGSDPFIPANSTASRPAAVSQNSNFNPFL